MRARASERARVGENERKIQTEREKEIQRETVNEGERGRDKEIYIYRMKIRAVGKGFFLRRAHSLSHIHTTINRRGTRSK